MTAWLLTWLWQGIAVAAGVSMTLRFLPRVNAATRYVVWWGALASLVWLGWSSNDHLSGFAVRELGFDPSRVPSDPRFPMPESRHFILQIQALPSWILTALMTVWLAVALIKLCRILPALHHVYALNDSCRPFPSEIERQLPLWQEARASGRRARLMLCDKLAGAAVVGFDRPCIAMPFSLVGALSLDELDQIILHEYGHVQRRDDWMRLIQTLIESALWIHPATFWIGRSMNLEREVACDDWVVARTGSPKNYARCLSRAAEVRGRVLQRVFAPAFFSGPRDLVRRVDRLLDMNRNRRRKLSTVAASVGVCSLALISVQLQAIPLIGEGIVDRRSSIVHRPSSIVDRRSSMVDGPSSMVDGRSSRVDGRSSMGEPIDDGRLTRAQEAIVDARSATVDRQLSLDQTMDDGRWTIDDRRVDEHIPALLDARSFQGDYQTTNAPTAQTTRVNREEPDAWQLAGTASAKATAVKTAGVGIAGAAKKASVGMASTFTRAGVSLARSF